LLLRMSTLFLRTLRDDPADAEVPSHRLLVRGGYVRRIAPGIFSWLPLGYQVLRNVEQIVRQQMVDAGFQEVHFPALLPREAYEATGRWDDYGDTLFKLQDRKGGDYLLGPTHEEMFTLLVKSEYSSYKDLPVSLFQIQTKYRDEARPRAGILRGREFVMKDSYSFDSTDEGLTESYGRHRVAYVKTFDALGLDYVIVSATSGAMGGSASEEFLAPCENGEDTFVRCDSCDYAANVEAVTTTVNIVSDRDIEPSRIVNTPDCETIESLVSFANGSGELARDQSWTAADTLKNVVLMVTEPDGTQAPLVVGIPGDRELDPKRLEAALTPAEVRPFEAADFAKYSVLVKGYLGPQVLGVESDSQIRYLVDPRVAGGTVWMTGANSPGAHAVNVVAGRDFTADGTIEAAEVREGDPCPVCGGGLTLARGIEIGHIFQLGRKYARALDLQVLDVNGKRVVVTMGSYGIGVSRAVAAVAEQNHDDIGLIWPRSIAPADIQVLAAGKDETIRNGAEQLALNLEAAGLRVLLDDRKAASPGVKFKDAELLGMPTIVVVGRGLANGVVELRDRRSGAKQDVPIGEAVDTIVAACRG